MKSNLLHINLDKSCYIDFKPINEKDNNENEAPNIIKGNKKRKKVNSIEKSKISFISLNGIPLKEVIDTKFLRVTIDNKLSWEIYCSNSRKKLKSATGLLARIRHNIPQENYKCLYFICSI